MDNRLQFHLGKTKSTLLETKPKFKCRLPQLNVSGNGVHINSSSSVEWRDEVRQRPGEVLALMIGQKTVVFFCGGHNHISKILFLERPHQISSMKREIEIKRIGKLILFCMKA